MRLPAIAPVVIVLLALAPLAYMGTYYAMLEDRSLARYTPKGGGCVLVPIYRTDLESIDRFLWPAHEVDRHIRRSYWTFTIEIEVLDFD